MFNSWLRIWLVAARSWVSLSESHMIAVFMHGLIDTFLMGGVESITLPSQNKLLFMLNLVGVFVANGSCHSHALIVKVKDKVVLAHHCSTQDHLTSVLNIDGNAVATRLFAIEILRGVPVKLIIFIGSAKLKAQDWERAEVIVRAFGELFLVVAEAKVALATKINPALAVILRVERAKPVEM